MVYFDTCGLYIQSCTTLQAKIAAIDLIIQALEDASLSAASSSNVSEYQLNDGQTIIKELFRGPKGIADSINAYEAIKQRYVNRLNGRVVRGVDSKNFRHNYGNRF